jgi:hypothetical protein
MKANITFKTHSDPINYAGNIHILTFAEQGFSTLDIHGRRLGVSRDLLSAFADAVNQADEVGSLYPQTHLSAVPRSCVRDTADHTFLLRHLREFLAANADHKSKTLVLDFSTPKLPEHAEIAINIALDSIACDCAEEVIIIKN